MEIGIFAYNEPSFRLFKRLGYQEFARRNEGSSEARIRTNMHGTLTRKFVDLMGEYQEIQTKYKNKYRERVERQYRIVNPDATQVQIDDAFDSHQGDLFTQQILQGAGHAAARTALAEIQVCSKHWTRDRCRPSPCPWLEGPLLLPGAAP